MFLANMKVCVFPIHFRTTQSPSFFFFFSFIGLSLGNVLLTRVCICINKAARHEFLQHLSILGLFPLRTIWMMKIQLFDVKIVGWYLLCTILFGLQDQTYSTNTFHSLLKNLKNRFRFWINNTDIITSVINFRKRNDTDLKRTIFKFN